MFKTYRANTNISINVVLPSKKNLHVAFNALSNGSSVYTTDNEEIQNAIECHYKFGKLFQLISSTKKSVEKPKVEKVDTKKSNTTENEVIDTEGEVIDAPVEDNEENDNENNEEPSEDNEDENSDTPAESTLRKIKVSDIATAKDYLAEKFGISRTSMRSTKAIMEHAKAQGIEFVGL